MHILEYFPVDASQAIFFGLTIGERLLAGAFMGGIGALVCLALASWSHFHFKKADRIHKLMSDTKTTPIGSLKPGPVEIKGKVNSTLPPIPSPWTQKHGVFYQFLVQEYHQGEHSGRWFDYINDRSDDPFLIEVETGSVEISPGEAQFQIKTERSTASGSIMDETENTGEQDRTISNSSWDGVDAPEDLRTLLKTRYGKDTRGLLGNITLKYTESILQNGDEVYVFGEVRQEKGKFVIGTGQMPLIISENGESGVEEEYEQKASDGKSAVKSLLIFAGVLGIILFLIGVFVSS
jgi:hypothetical protein